MSLNGATLRVLYCKQVLDMSYGIRVKYWLDEDSGKEEIVEGQSVSSDGIERKQ